MDISQVSNVSINLTLYNMGEKFPSTDFYELEQELVKKAKTDDASFTILYNHYFPKIYGFVVKRTSHRETAEDIVSMVFTNAFTHLDTYEGKNCTFGAWLYKIATNKLIDHYRKEGKSFSISIDETFEMADESINLAGGVDGTISRGNIDKVLNVLPEKYQRIIYLKFFSELQNIEIAQALNISPNNVGVLLFRALKKFKKEYEKYV